MIIYVDDIILTSDDNIELKRLKKKLVGDIKINDLGALKYFLGMELFKFKKCIFIIQQKYILDLLDEIRLLGCKTIKTPIETNLKLQPAKNKEVMN